MADYFTQLSLIVPMPQDQAEWCVALHQACVDCFDDHDLLAALHTQDANYVSDVESMIDSGHESTGLDVTADAKGLWVQSEDCANLEYLAEFLQSYLRHFNITDRRIGFQWANTCSKMRPDGFGGGACVVSHDDARWVNTDGWLEETAQAMMPAAEEWWPKV